MIDFLIEFYFMGFLIFCGKLNFLLIFESSPLKVEADYASFSSFYNNSSGEFCYLKAISSSLSLRKVLIIVIDLRRVWLLLFLIELSN